MKKIIGLVALTVAVLFSIRTAIAATSCIIRGSIERTAAATDTKSLTSFDSRCFMTDVGPGMKFKSTPPTGFLFIVR